MDEPRKAGDNSETLLRFGILLEKTIKGNQVQFRITSNNQGISDPEVILILEAWLDKVKNQFKGSVTSNLKFRKEDDAGE